MLGNYGVKDGEDTLRPHVTAELFKQTIEMWKRFRMIVKYSYR